MRTLITTTFVSVAIGVSAYGQAPPEHDAADLAKQLSNPVASLVSVPFQLNWEQGVGPGEDLRTLINFQPVLPFSLTPGTNLVARIILPYVSQPSLAAGAAPTSGFGDILFSMFFSPARSKGVIWALGPVLSLPMSADPFLGSGKWGIGPTGIVLKQAGSWTVGALVNHVWSFAGDPDRADVSQTFIQPFLAYGLKSGVTLTLQSESSANWKAESGEEWTVPINGQVSKVVKLGRHPMSIAFGAGYYVESPEGGPEWKIRTAITLLFPTASPAK